MRGEFASIVAMTALLPRPGDDVAVWIGDDAAAVRCEGRSWLLLAADTVVGGVHADLGLTGIDDLGWKAVAASVSDIAAMGGEAAHTLVTVAGPPDTDLELLYRGVAAASSAFGCPVVGGDLTNSDTLVVTVAVTGYCDGPPVRRNGAQPGESVWVTGPLGGAAAGLRLLRAERSGADGDPPLRTGPQTEAAADAERRHARPVPLLRAGAAARRAGATAMIDVSDGLTADLEHVASASGVGLRLRVVPSHDAASVEEALSGGEDFELVFCAPDDEAVGEAFAGLGAPVRIGVCVADPAERTLDGRPYVPGGWEHAWSRRAGDGGPGEQK